MNKGDKFILHSEDENDYQIEIISVNEYRPPDMIYALSITFPDGTTYYQRYGDDYFCGEEFLSKCEKMK